MLDADVRLVPLSMEEREVALGYRPGDTVALDPASGKSLTYEERHAITGACMDAHTLEALVAASLTLRLHHLSCAGPTIADFLVTRCAVGTPVLTAAACRQGALLRWGWSLPPLLSVLQRSPQQMCFARAVCLSAAAIASEAVTGAPVDVWDDALCMEYLRQGDFSAETVAET